MPGTRMTVRVPARPHRGSRGREDPVTGATGSATRTFGINVGFSSVAGAHVSVGLWTVTAP
jgi:hypothetical protein